ncbi:Calcineurin-like phosphoesterase [Frankineae bacterium MT45]|nr:Calcineurin-like phosphoesterase [Frankineae bacterium MT45]
MLDVDFGAPESPDAHSETTYLSRAPFVSLIQSYVEEALGDGPGIDPSHPDSLWAKIVHSVHEAALSAEHAVEHLLHKEPGSFGPDDPDWHVYIAKGVLDRLLDGTHPFNTKPAEFDNLADDARLVVVGDWATGLPNALHVAERMRDAIQEALDRSQQVHVIHLGDIYYAGLESEDRRRFLDCWPVTPDQADAVYSWCINGNHDMYSGGHGYFTVVLADKRFAHQQDVDGKPTSYFRLRSASWDFIGLDTAWNDDITSHGRVADLPDPQSEYVARVAGESDRKLVLFSHHQLASAYEPDDIGTKLPAQLDTVLAQEGIKAWWWGHEHRAITYKPLAGVQYPRCLGNGGVPTPANEPDPPNPLPGDNIYLHPDATWRSERTYEASGQEIHMFGFAVLDLHPDGIDVAYVDHDGDVAHTERIQ